MADKRKYVSEFEIKSNIDEALKQLQKYYVEFSKMPNIIDSFGKALKKNEKLEKNFYDMMSAIPKRMKQLSQLANIKLVPRKELDRLTDMFKTIETASKSLQGKAFNADEIKSIITEFEKVTSELDSMESRHSKLNAKSEAFNNLLEGTLKLQKNLSSNSEKYKSSTEDITKTYKSLFGKINQIYGVLKKAGEEGITNKTLIEYSNRLESVRQEVNLMNNDYDDMNKNINNLSGEFDKILGSSRDIAGQMQNSIAKTSYENVVSDIESLRRQLDLTLSDSKQTSEELQNNLNKIKIELDNNVDSLNLALKADERLTAETKTTNDAFNLMSKLTAEVQEGLQDITNIQLKTQFEEVAKQIALMREELERSILIDKESNEVIREKMGMLKNLGDELRSIQNRQLDINKLEEQSISATVKRAREQNKVNKAYIKQIFSEKRGFGGVVDAFKVYKQNIPIAMTAKFGQTGLAAAKLMTGAFKMLGHVLAPFLGVFSFIGMLKTVFELEKQVKSARKQIVMMAAGTHNLGNAFEQVRSGAALVDTGIEKMRNRAEKWSWDLGMSMEQIIGYMNDFTKAGFTATSSLSNLENLMAISVTLDMEVSELAASAGNLRAEFGMSLSDIGSSFIQMQKDAKNAGITTTIFFDKVINAATGLGLYGKRIDEVSNLFSGLVKNMQLPEKAATDAAGKIVGSFKDLSNEAQITIFRLGGGAKIWEESYKEQTTKIDKQISELIEKEKDLGNVQDDSAKQIELNELRKQRAMLESQKRTLANTASLKGVNAELEKGLMTDTMGQFLMQMGFLTKKAAGVDITGGIENVQKAIEQNVLRMKVIGAEFGMDREVVETMRNLSSNLLFNANSLKEAFGRKEAEGLIQVLAKTSDHSKRQTGLLNHLNKLQEKGKINKSVVDVLKKSFPLLEHELSQEGADTADGLSKILSSLDVSFGALTQTTKDSIKKQEELQAKRVGIEVLRQTKSTEDAINNTIGKIMRDVFVALEKFVTMFRFLHKKDLQEFDALNDTITENFGKIQDARTNIAQRRSSLKLEREQTQDKERIKAIDNELSSLDETSKLLDEYNDSLRGQQRQLMNKGELTKEQIDLNQKSNELAKKIMQNPNVGVGFGGRTIWEARSVFGIGGGIRSHEQIQYKKGKGFADGGVVPGSSFYGDKMLAPVNSGETREMIVPRDVWKGGGSGRTINDNRVINIYVNQNDRRQVEQVVLNALYTDKMFK